MESERKQKGELLDPDDIFEGLDIGKRFAPARFVWGWMEYYYATGKPSFSFLTTMVIFHFLGISYTVLGVLGAFYADLNLRGRTAALMNPICCVQATFKCYCTAFALDEYVKMLKFLRRDFLTCVPENQKEAASALVKANVEKANKVMTYALAWNVFTFFVLSIKPYLSSQVFREFTGIGEGPIVSNKVFENEYPFDWKMTPTTYYLTMTFEHIACFLDLTTSGVFQAILILLVMAVVIHLRVLGFTLENLKATDFAPENFMSLTAEQKERAHEQLIRCIKDHQKLIKAGDALAERYNGFLTVHLSTAILLGIVSAYNGVSADEVVAKVNFFVMCVYGLLEVAIYCILGQFLVNASEELLDQVYRSDWHAMSPQFRYSAQLMMARSNLPFRLCAGRLYTVNHETLGNILQLVYTSMTVLLSAE